MYTDDAETPTHDLWKSLSICMFVCGLGRNIGKIGCSTSMKYRSDNFESPYSQSCEQTSGNTHV